MRQNKSKKSSWPIILVGILFLFVGVAFTGTHFVQSTAQKQAKKYVDRALAQAKSKAEIKYKKVSVSLWTQAFHLRGLQITPAGKTEPILVDKVTVWGIDKDSLVEIGKTRKFKLPKTISLAMSDVKVPTSYLGEQGKMALGQLGYTDVAGDFQISLMLEPEANRFSIEEMIVYVNNMASITMSFGVTDFDVPTIMAAVKNSELPIQQRLHALENAKLRSFALTYEDDSLATRAIKWFVQSGEANPVDLVDLAIKTSTETRKIASNEQTFHVRALKSLRRFVAKPDSISIQARPAQPIPFLSLMDEKSGGSIDELAGKLNLTVESD